MRDHLLKLMREEVGLPVLPEVLIRLDKELRNPEVEVKSVASVIAMDPVLAGQVLRMANSAYYSRGGAPIASPSAAVMRLGIRTVHGLVYALSLPRAFPQRPQGSAFSHTQFWKHSLAVGAFAQGLARHIKLPAASQDLVYFAGLVHDVGALLMLTLIPQEYSAFLNALESMDQDQEFPGKQDTSDLSIREFSQFGISHAELGALFLEERWKMEQPLIRIVKEHHQPDWSDPSLLKEVMIVHLADGVCASTGASWDSLSPQNLPFLETVWERLEISLDDVDLLLEQMHSSLDQANALLNATAG
jgi:HD-like signal output (HDOD) protein